MESSESSLPLNVTFLARPMDQGGNRKHLVSKPLPFLIQTLNNEVGIVQYL